MGFIKDEVVPLAPPKTVRVLHNEVVRRDANVKRREIGPTLSLHLSLLGAAVIRHYLERRTELLELRVPIQQHTGWHHNKMRTPYTVPTRKVRQQ